MPKDQRESIIGVPIGAPKGRAMRLKARGRLKTNFDTMTLVVLPFGAPIGTPIIDFLWSLGISKIDPIC